LPIAAFRFSPAQPGGEAVAIEGDGGIVVDQRRLPVVGAAGSGAVDIGLGAGAVAQHFLADHGGAGADDVGAGHAGAMDRAQFLAADGVVGAGGRRQGQRRQQRQEDGKTHDGPRRFRRGEIRPAALSIAG
jgi:hypothetical protein